MSQTNHLINMHGPLNTVIHVYLEKQHCAWFLSLWEVTTDFKIGFQSKQTKPFILLSFTISV